MLQKQYGVIPWLTRSGKMKIILVSSRSRGQWIVPKGNLIPKRSKRESALQEAYEEAGLKGKLDKNFKYRLFIYSRGVKTDLTLYAMRVERQMLKKWPESHQRKRIEVSCERAQSLVSWPRFKRAVKLLQKSI
jgi:8-oxo-dGTP pyrophosphatase MutT (NUDIX family)